MRSGLLLGPRVWQGQRCSESPLPHPWWSPLVVPSVRRGLIARKEAAFLNDNDINIVFFGKIFKEL